MLNLSSFLACVNSAIIWMFGTCFLSFSLNALSWKWWFGCVHENSIPIFSSKSQPLVLSEQKAKCFPSPRFKDRVLSPKVQGGRMVCRNQLADGKLTWVQWISVVLDIVLLYKKNLTHLCFKLQTESYLIGCSFWLVQRLRKICPKPVFCRTHFSTHMKEIGEITCIFVSGTNKKVPIELPRC